MVDQVLEFLHLARADECPLVWLVATLHQGSDGVHTGGTQQLTHLGQRLDLVGLCREVGHNDGTLTLALIDYLVVAHTPAQITRWGSPCNETAAVRRSRDYANDVLPSPILTL